MDEDAADCSAVLKIRARRAARQLRRLPRVSALPLGMVALSLAGLAPALASDTDERQGVSRALGQDRFVAGETAAPREAVSGDLFAAGGEVRVDQPVGGDLVAAGGEVRIDAAAAQDAYVAGGRIDLNGAIGRNARLAGGRVDIGSRARIDGNATVAGGRITVRGPVNGYLQAAGERIYIDGPVAGDAEAHGRIVELGPDARIGGRLRYISEGELIRAPQAQVGGGVERLSGSDAWTGLRIAGRGALELAFWIWTAGMMLLGGVLVAAAPEVSARIAAAVRGRLGLSLVLGFVSLVAAPVAAILLVATGVGAPLGLLALIAYAAALLLGYAYTGVALGEVALTVLRGRTASIGARALAAALALLLLALASRIPILGAIIAALALVVGVGALVLQLRASGRRAAA